MLDVAFSKSALPKTGILALLIGEGEKPEGLWAEAEKASGGLIGRALAAANFKGKAGQSCTILAPIAGVARIVAVGLGKRDATNTRGYEEAGGTAAAASSTQEILTLATGGTAEQAAHAALGAALRVYRFDKYRTNEKPEDLPKLGRVVIAHDDHAKAKAAWPNLAAIADGVFLTRDLVSEPANVLSPVEFAKRCEELKDLGLKVKVLGLKEMKKLGFGALLGVAQGSANEPRLVVIEWHGATKKKSKPIAFVGKGVTFDTGGISIKPAGGMEDMKWDMAGAGTVAGLMAVLAQRHAKVNAVGILGLVENMPSGTAMRPGDVVTSYSGQTVEVLNTDAEGRLVLADALWYCQEQFDPRFMVNLATLTGAIIIALGHDFAGMFSNDDTLAQQLAAAGDATGEKLWRMPLADSYDKMLKSDIADMKNIGGRPGGSITAAQFVQRFVNGRPWAHLDIAGTAWASKDTAVTPKGATAFGVRLLNQFVATHFED